MKNDFFFSREIKFLEMKVTQHIKTEDINNCYGVMLVFYQYIISFHFRPHITEEGEFTLSNI